MATINLGRIKPVFRGAYDGATAYVVDAVLLQNEGWYLLLTVMVN